MGEGICWRVASSDDLTALALLVNSAYRGAPSRRGWTTEADLLDGQRTDPETLGTTLATEGNTFLVLERGGVLLGSVFLQRKADRAHLGMLTVRPDLQTAGLGRRLLSIAERWVREHWRLPLVEMTVIQVRTELIGWYERRGYRPTGRREPFPYGNRKCGIPKRDDLEFVVLEKPLSEHQIEVPDERVPHRLAVAPGERRVREGDQ